MVWLAMAPARPRRDVADRLDEYLARGDVIQALEMQAPLARRALAPAARRVLHYLGGLWPSRNVALTEQRLEQAGRPLGMTALDYQGLRLLATLGLFALFAFLALRQGQGWSIVLRNGLLAGLIGFVFATYWLRMRVNRRRHAIQRALPDALDMMTIGVVGGLAVESAGMRVGDLGQRADGRAATRRGRDARRDEPRGGAQAHGGPLRRGRFEHLRGGAGAVQRAGRQHRGGAAHPGGSDAAEAASARRGAGAAGRRQDGVPAGVADLPGHIHRVLGPLLVNGILASCFRSNW
jgi:hypothetical protein